MTSDKTRKQRVRMEQQATGARYTVAARRIGQAQQTGPAESFTLGDLLHEATTEPAFVFPACGCGELDCAETHNWEPRSFDSRLVGTMVATGTVLELAGSLAQRDLVAPLQVESVSPPDSAVLACRVDASSSSCSRPWSTTSAAAQGATATYPTTTPGARSTSRSSMSRNSSLRPQPGGTGALRQLTTTQNAAAAREPNP